MRKLLVVAAAALACAVLSAQAGRPTFEVASVKRNTSGPGPSGLFFQPGGRLQVTNRTLRTIISAAYGTPQPLAEYQLIGGPKWLDTDRFDITAKAAGDPQPGPSGPPPSMFLMLQSLLEERFHLKMHRETQELPIFVLTLARGDGRLGPQMHASATDCAALRTSLLARGGGPPPMPLPGERPQCGARQYPGTISAGSMTIAQMVSGL